ncbi:DUF3093 domain-containing protein [Leifsonia sp. Leaf264]|uniref:DUF3093 domain-containing protein n=1 Tax=Leifsonia sp. Leaf264 TaxID=1736314 RepID=UPI0006F40FFA|nr:DUF3093 domain-containing protein [Leifsonia sp. Leaf264]KQO99781.1 hypothetical protein ASF30_07785 [Leifsonia sp. Leaf264]
MPDYRERLWPAPWLFISTALVIPASILVLAPISVTAGIITAIVLYGGCVAGLILSAPTVTVADGRLSAGKASIPLSLVGDATSYSGQAAWRERGPNLDARAWLMIRGYVDDVVKVPLLPAAEDPAPYWIVSTRHGRELAAAINGSQRPVESNDDVS